ncbi:sugar phosphate nucleotidyltransferase [Rubricoccus marinus]|uniref:Glucose-1-phosphate cytidylyltransferase n=1 Tax=Rubricoccus marinus TaxID=716817 RepID=A0A259TZN9_9BACT|nr:sugar phosphate nucleotidyltransferase [Rubricoccus marinus]OZC03048.1 glucose-1-phosphate cytidylyltransferase [Rubricoccus marinus]
MKVVLFCGGEGMRIRDHSGPLPKPMVCIGYRPILWHVMKYYAHYGHKDFILCLGHGADHIKRYFVDYDETVSNDFVMEAGGKVDLLQSDIHDWRITFVDTGMKSNVGERLQAVRPFLKGEEWFLANYADGVTSAPLGEMIDFAKASGRAATFLGVQPNYTSHVVRSDADGNVLGIEHVTEIGLRINGGFFVLNERVFDYMQPGDDLMGDPAHRMTAAGELGTFMHNGFWACMDTFKEKQLLEDIHSGGGAPWEVWSHDPPYTGDGASPAVSASGAAPQAPIPAPEA